MAAVGRDSRHPPRPAARAASSDSARPTSSAGNDGAAAISSTVRARRALARDARRRVACEPAALQAATRSASAVHPAALVAAAAAAAAAAGPRRGRPGRPGMSPPTRVRWNVEKSFCRSVDVHSGQATTIAPLDETSSSNRWSQLAHWYS